MPNIPFVYQTELESSVCSYTTIICIQYIGYTNSKASSVFSLLRNMWKKLFYKQLFCLFENNNSRPIYNLSHNHITPYQFGSVKLSSTFWPHMWMHWIFLTSHSIWKWFWPRILMKKKNDLTAKNRDLTHPFQDPIKRLYETNLSFHFVSRRICVWNGRIEITRRSEFELKPSPFHTVAAKRKRFIQKPGSY